MRPITGNPKSQGKHGKYNAVDYSPWADYPKRTIWDPNIYAPEDGEIVFYGENGDAGIQIQLKGKTGRTGIAHTDPAFRLVEVGQRVKVGQHIGVMGYTGYTEPKGKAGTHAHQTLLLPNGTYVYPPDLITEPFGGGDKMTLEQRQKQAEDIVGALYRHATGIDPTQEQQAYWIPRVRDNPNGAKELDQALPKLRVATVNDLKYLYLGIYAQDVPDKQLEKDPYLGQDLGLVAMRLCDYANKNDFAYWQYKPKAEKRIKELEADGTYEPVAQVDGKTTLWRKK